MPSLKDLQKNTKEFKETIIDPAHFLEHQWVNTKLDWPSGSLLLKKLFPRETKVERPQVWYKHLRGTHWPKEVPPGNGPFYIPEWVFEPEELEKYTQVLKKNGFKQIEAHVVVLPDTGEYLVKAMRAAGDFQWNVNPRTYRAYIYPRFGTKKKELRNYTTERWIFNK